MRMRSMSVWTRLVLVIYLAAVVVVCLYVPAHASEPVLIHKPPTGVTVLSGPTMASFGYRRVWDLTETYSVVMGGDLYYYRTEASVDYRPVSYTHLRAHETRHDLVCRLLLVKKKKTLDTS